MMNGLQVEHVAAFAASVAIAGGAAGGLFLYLRPRWRRLRDRLDAGLESVTGRDAIIDQASGRELSPAVPGIGVRMANVEDTLTMLVANREILDDHGRRIAKLETAAVERIVNRADSALAWSAVKAAIDAEAPPADVDVDELDDGTDL